MSNKFQINKTQNIFLKFFSKFNIYNQNQIILFYLLICVLVTIPLIHIFGSVSLILFIGFSIPYLFQNKPKLNISLLLPICFFGLMTLSVLWSINPELSLKGLQKQLPLLLLPLAFIFNPTFTKQQLKQLFKIYSYSMLIFAVFFIVRAIFNYIETQQISVFFNHNLVTEDLNAIYASVFVSFAIFYFISQPKISNLEKYILAILVVFVFMLSSKSILTIDFVLIFCYYAFYSKIDKSVRSLTLFVVFLFLISSLFFVKNVQKRFLLEYQTAFIDNTVNKKLSQEANSVYKVSIFQAWTVNKFEQNHFFPGTALRVYQFRIFKEFLFQDDIFFNGFGLNTSQDKIKEKAKEHNLFYGYGEFNFHNQYLQSFSEVGVFGFIFILGMLIINLKNAIFSKNFLHLSFALTMFLLFLSESLFCRQRGVFFFVVLYCIFNTTFKNETENFNKQIDFI